MFQYITIYLLWTFMQKKKFYSELAYVVGLLLLAIGTAMMERANLGLSMIVAPAYIIHLKISQYLPFFSFGMAGFIVQGILLVVMSIILKKAKLSYLFSFVTAVIYGIVLDGVIWLFSLINYSSFVLDVVLFALGMPIVAMGVALLFNTYLPPEAYDLFVKEISNKFNLSLTKFKTAYDVCSFIVSVALSFTFFGWMHFEGIGIGTVICALLNGLLIGTFSKLYEDTFSFEDRFSWRKYF